MCNIAFYRVNMEKSVRLRKPWASEIFQECWSCIDQSQERLWQTSRPQNQKLYNCGQASHWLALFLEDNNIPEIFLSYELLFHSNITRQLIIISTTVKPQHNKVPRDRENLWKKPRFCDVEVLFHIIYYYWGRQKLYFVISRTLLIEVCYIKFSLALSLYLSPSCRDIIVSECSERGISIFNFYACMFWLFELKDWVGAGAHQIWWAPCGRHAPFPPLPPSP